MTHRILGSAAWVAALLPAMLAAQPPSAGDAANRWNPDPAHSAVTFRVRHLGLTWVNGAFRQWTAELTYDPAKPEASTVTARIQTASVDTENERRDGDLKANYLRVDSFPEMTFESRKVEAAGPNRLRVSGDLTLRGITKAVVLDTEVGGVLTTPRGRRTAFTATTTIRRQDFGITLNRLMEGAQVVGDEVRITIDIEAIEPRPPG
jgi:polyisoprenoid-binding protein YceI